MDLVAKPFIKWAGGKRQLLEQLNSHFPEDLKNGKIKRYVEPFLGGGAVFFDLVQKYNFDEIVLNDINKELILAYKVIKEQPKDLIEQLKIIEHRYNLFEELSDKEAYFYELRTMFNTSKMKLQTNQITDSGIIHSALFIALNKTGFNGLYRENKKGLFNVPFGKHKSPNIADEENILAVSKSLERVKLISHDFELLSEHSDSQTFFYFDPPYRPLSRSSSFESYSKDGFSDSEQERLANFYHSIHTKNEGVKLLLSNSNPKNTNPDDDFFHNIYKHEQIVIEEVQASRAINSKSTGRGKISELLIKNYNE